LSGHSQLFSEGSPSRWRPKQSLKTVMDKKITRRNFIKTAAVTTGGGALGGAAFAAQGMPAPSQGPPANVPPRPRRKADVVVVGGGFAGLTAAYRISQAGRSVILIEANPPVGGRTWTGYLSDGTPFEIGGAWVSGTDTQSNIKELMMELGIGKFRQFVDGDGIFELSTGEVVPWPKDTLPPISDEALLNLGQAMVKISAMAEVVNLEKPWENVAFPPDVGPASSVAADQITVQNWLDEEMLDDDGKRVLAAGLAGTLAVDPNAVSLLQMLWFVKTFGSVDGLPPPPLNIFGTGVGQANAFRIPQGMTSITDVMAQRKAADDRRVGAPLRRCRPRRPDTPAVPADSLPGCSATKSGFR
jgi:monoamine oxidase